MSASLAVRIPPAARAARAAPAARRSQPLGSLRTSLTLLVVAHHAALAYHRHAPPVPPSLRAAPPLWPAFPIVDPRRWAGAELFVGFNDVFFMSLMFFVSGAFAWPSLVRRGPAGVVRERLLRLGVPFVASAVLLTPLAYAATYVQLSRSAGADPTPAGFVREWTALGWWPAGPAWFLWLLLAFGAAAAALSALAPAWGAALGRATERLTVRPAAYAAALGACSAAVYLPAAAASTPDHWATVGPFSVQTSRLLHYGVYFFAGIGVGAAGLGRGLLAEGGRLARRWAPWIGAAAAAFAAYVAAGRAVAESRGAPGAALLAVRDLAFVLSCACSSMALLAAFVRWARSTGAAWEGLGANAYGVYLLHYACVTWLQLALLGAPLPGAAKALLVAAAAAAAAAAGWGLSAALRRLPAVARVV